MKREPTWIRTTDELRAWLAGPGRGPLAVDTEADSLHRYPERVCLLQLSTAEEDVLVDPLAGVDLAACGPRFADPAARKVLHGADYDVRILGRDYGLRLGGVFDTMIAARLVGERAFGLAALLERTFGVRLEKRFQRADWSARPLPKDMEAYAVLDTRHLLPLAAHLDERLRALGRRAWADEEFARVEDVRWKDEDDPEAFRRIRGSGALDRRGLAVLRELHAWRDAEARRRGRPPFMVLGNPELLRLARERPASARGIAAAAWLPARWRRGDGPERLAEVIGRGRTVPEAELPALPERRPRRSAAFESRLRALQQERDAVAARLDLEPSVLASRHVLEAAIERAERGEDPAAVPELRGWQRALIETALRGVG